MHTYIIHVSTCMYRYVPFPLYTTVLIFPVVERMMLQGPPGGGLQYIYMYNTCIYTYM